jgi:hypothetical protein
VNDCSQIKTLDDVGDWISRDECAAYLGCSQASVDALRAEGAIVSFVIKRRVRINTASVRRYVDVLVLEAEKKRLAVPRFSSDAIAALMRPA